MILELNGIDVECIIGERAEERTRTQRLLVDVRLEIGTPRSPRRYGPRSWRRSAG